ncbi:protein-glutamate O-methyltransferase CheR [Novosphingobium flavum]|uniref:Chemotaxis protein methyltransferase n=1 Tax=Novosphingobium flavum TaxID=1778672 RepID=A0A7X1KLH3_9SPHN|nr:protein-glutamate O-methyltransferase CheR [Novosphingobium flavum]MBC2665606.1 protein-glutamate O-methyltransferase CheR [Novosphingobium flavum]
MLAETFDTGAMSGISPGIYSPADFAAISGIVHETAGIVLPPTKSMLVYSRLAPLVRGTGTATFAAYVELIRRDKRERTRAIEALTTNHTFFYREAHHFEHFTAEARPELVRMARAGQPVRLWSAGCSSGEETWSLVLSLLGTDRAEGRQIAQSDTLVLATDLASHVLARAEAATYPAGELDALPAPLREGWVERAGSDARIAAEARGLVRFRLLNLLGQWPLSRPFDAIFCRNVMIYFDLPTKERLVSRLADQLKPGGFLYIGHSERVSGPAERDLDQVGPTIYQRRAA